MLRPIAVSLFALFSTVLARGAVPVPGDAPVKTTFRVRVENVSTDATLHLSTGGTAPAPTAPVLWVVHTTPDPLFSAGAVDRGRGLESLAEDGSPAALAASLSGAEGIVAVGMVTTPTGATEPGPILPGNSYEFTVQAERAQHLTLAFMFGQSNDLFFAPEGKGIRLFDADGTPARGDITSELKLWDAGTEVNQEPGLGSDQAPRQAAANTGSAEHATVRRIEDVHDGFEYPPVRRVVRVTIEPRG